MKKFKVKNDTIVQESEQVIAAQEVVVSSADIRQQIADMEMAADNLADAIKSLKADLKEVEKLEADLPKEVENE